MSSKNGPKKRRDHDLSQFGLTDIPDDFDVTGGAGGDDDNDSDLEAELAAIVGGGGRAKPKPPPKSRNIASELDRMVAASMKDISDDDDDDCENDDDLLSELHGITGTEVENDANEEDTAAEVSSPKEATPENYLPTTTMDTVALLQQRIEMYQQAEANAKAAGETAKCRRIGRGLKTLMDMLKQAKNGKAINVDDIPPEVSVKSKATNANDGAEEPPQIPQRAAPPIPPRAGSGEGTPKTSPQRAAPPPPPPAAEEAPSSPRQEEPADPKAKLMECLRSRQHEYKAAALQSKRSGDTATALQFIKVVKQFDVVMKMAEEGQDVDLSDMPPPPAEFLEFLAKMQEGNALNVPTDDAPQPPPPAAAPAVVAPVKQATTILEALEERLDKYQSVESAAKAEGNASKARRFGRIVKQYQDAIKAYKAGRPVAYDELPVPPGFGPLPTENGGGGGAAKPSPPAATPPSSTPPPASATASTDITPESSPSAVPKKRPTPPQKIELTTRTTGNQHKNNLAEEQMKLLLSRQHEFKVAALEAKKAGEMEQAKEYLKIYKGFDSLLNAASSGLPVDLSTLPLPPSQRENLEASFAIAAGDDDSDANNDDISDISVRVEEQLVKQLMMCKNTRDHHKAMGDITGMNRFENLAMTVQKDLDLVRYSKRKNFQLPKFHYEKRSFNIVHCNTELTDSELEIVVVRGISYKVPNPKDVDTYVKVEFPLPNDESFKTKTNVVKNTDNPSYDQRFTVEIQRNNRTFQRIFKRHGVKFEIYSRGGFLRSDTLIGVVNVKLQPLETKCDIHDTFDLMEGRKTVGGKLEVKLRVRNPILTKQVEHINEKWLVLDG